MAEYEIGVKQVEPLVSKPLSQDSGINAVQTLTVAAVSTKSHVITSLEVSISGAAAGNL